MRLSRTQTVLALLLVALLAGFSLFQASWLAPDPTGKPKLIADRPLDLVRDTAGCISEANSGYGAVRVNADVGAYQAAVGLSADAIRVPVDNLGDILMVARQYKSTCAADAARPRANVLEAAAAMSKPTIFWQVGNIADARRLIATLPLPKPDTPDRNVFIGSDAAIKEIREAQPKARAFSISGAQACTSEYRLSGLWGKVPDSCKGGVMLLTLGDLGFTLWGWPNRFLERMKAADVQVIVAQDIDGRQIKGLTDVHQYGDIAHSYNGWIWIDKIEELGPALRR